MKSKFLTLVALFALLPHAMAAVSIDEEAFGKSLGGWKKRSKAAAEYPLSGADYRTYKPEISPTPDGGIFVSVRIDHVRGWLATDDHAVLEVTVNSKGGISAAQSSIAIQGRSIKSDVIQSGNEAGKAIFSPEGAVQIGTDLVSDLSAKLLRENIVEAGRVSFPSVLRHNYNKLFQSIRVEATMIEAAVPVPDEPVVPPPAKTEAEEKKEAAPAAEPKKEAPPAEKPKDPAPAEQKPGTPPLEIKPYF